MFGHDNRELTAVFVGGAVGTAARAGLATVLVEMLARRALECGITDFTAMFLAANRPVTELAHDGQARVVVAEGVAHLRAALTEPHPNWPDLGHSGNGHR